MNTFIIFRFISWNRAFFITSVLLVLVECLPITIVSAQENTDVGGNFPINYQLLPCKNKPGIHLENKECLEFLFDRIENAFVIHNGGCEGESIRTKLWQLGKFAIVSSKEIVGFTCFKVKHFDEQGNEKLLGILLPTSLKDIAYYIIQPVQSEASPSQNTEHVYGNCFNENASSYSEGCLQFLNPPATATLKPDGCFSKNTNKNRAVSFDTSDQSISYQILWKEKFRNEEGKYAICFEIVHSRSSNFTFKEKGYVVLLEETMGKNYRIIGISNLPKQPAESVNLNQNLILPQCNLPKYNGQDITLSRSSARFVLFVRDASSIPPMVDEYTVQKDTQQRAIIGSQKLHSLATFSNNLILPAHRIYISPKILNSQEVLHSSIHVVGLETSDNTSPLVQFPPSTLPEVPPFTILLFASNEALEALPLSKVAKEIAWQNTDNLRYKIHWFEITNDGILNEPRAYNSFAELDELFTPYKNLSDPNLKGLKPTIFPEKSVKIFNEVSSFIQNSNYNNAELGILLMAGARIDAGVSPVLQELFRQLDNERFFKFYGYSSYPPDASYQYVEIPIKTDGNGKFLRGSSNSQILTDDIIRNEVREWLGTIRNRSTSNNTPPTNTHNIPEQSDPWLKGIDIEPMSPSVLSGYLMSRETMAVMNSVLHAAIVTVEENKGITILEELEAKIAGMNLRKAFFEPSWLYKPLSSASSEESAQRTQRIQKIQEASNQIASLLGDGRQCNHFFIQDEFFY